MAKIILVTPTEEIPVGTIKSTIEAFQCAALLQALAIHSGYTYYVEHRVKGTLKRTQPDSLKATIANCKSLYDHIKPLYL